MDAGELLLGPTRRALERALVGRGHRRPPELRPAVLGPRRGPGRRRRPGTSGPALTAVPPTVGPAGAGRAGRRPRPARGVVERPLAAGRPVGRRRRPGRARPGGGPAAGDAALPRRRGGAAPAGPRGGAGRRRPRPGRPRLRGAGGPDAGAGAGRADGASAARDPLCPGPRACTGAASRSPGCWSPEPWDPDWEVDVASSHLGLDAAERERHAAVVTRAAGARDGGARRRRQRAPGRRGPTEAHDRDRPPGRGGHGPGGAPGRPRDLPGPRPAPRHRRAGRGPRAPGRRPRPPAPPDGVDPALLARASDHLPLLADLVPGPAPTVRP